MKVRKEESEISWQIQPQDLTWEGTSPIQIKIDKKRGVLWINTATACILRICNMQGVIAQDDDDMVDITLH